MQFGVVTQHKHVCGKLPGVPNIASGGPWGGRGENESCWLTQQMHYLMYARDVREGLLQEEASALLTLSCMPRRDVQICDGLLQVLAPACCSSNSQLDAATGASFPQAPALGLLIPQKHAPAVIDTFAQGLAEIKTHFDARLSKKCDQTAAPHTHPGRAQQPNWAFEPCVGQLTPALMAAMMPAQPQGFNASQLMMLPGLRQIPTAGKARNFAQLLSGPDPCNLGLSPNTSMYVGSCQECQTLQVVAHGVAGVRMSHHAG